MEHAELEFYKKASELRDNLISRNNTHVHILTELVSIYFRNGNNFPDELRIDHFNNRRISTVKEILLYIGFFNEIRFIESYKFIKKFYIVDGVAGEYRNYYLIIRPKSER